MGILDTFVKGSIDGVVIELDKGNTAYVPGEKVTVTDIHEYTSSINDSNYH